MSHPTFKTKLLKSPNYFTYRRISYLIGFLLLPVYALAGMLTSEYQLTILILLLVLLIPFVILSLHNGQNLKNSQGRDHLVCTPEEVRLGQEDDKSIRYPVQELTKITFYNSDRILGESIKEHLHDVFIKPAKQKLVLETDQNQTSQHYFLIESHYMIKQLEKIIPVWREKGLAVELKQT